MIIGRWNGTIEDRDVIGLEYLLANNERNKRLHDHSKALRISQQLHIPMR